MKRFLVWSLLGCLIALLSSGLVVSGYFAKSESATVAITVSPVAADIETPLPQQIDFDVLDGENRSTVTIECFGENQKGFMDFEGNLVIPQCFTTIYPFYEGLALVGFMESPEQERFGFINPQGVFVFPPTIRKEQLVLHDVDRYYRYGWSFPKDHHHGERFSAKRFPLRQLTNNKIGFIGPSGEWVIEPQFDSVGGFHEGVSRVCEAFDYGEMDDSKQRCGYVYPDGRLAMPLQLARATSFYDGIAQVRFPGKRGRTVINNQTFEPLIPNVIQSLGHVNAVVSGYSVIPYAWHVDSGLVNVLLPGCRYDSDRAYPFMGPEPPPAPPLPVDEDGEVGYEYWNPGPVTWGYVDVAKGGFAIQPRFCDEGFINEEFVDGRAVVRIHPNDPDPSIPDGWKGRLAMIDTTGKVVDNFGDEYTPDFLASWHAAEEGLLAIEIFTRDYLNEDIKDGYIDREGHWAIQPDYGLAENFREGLGLIGMQTEDGFRRGFINPDGQIAVPLSFDTAKEFSQGLAAAQDVTTEKWGFIDRQGEWVIESIFGSVDSFTSSSVARVSFNNFRNTAVINKQGEYVMPPSDDFNYSLRDWGNGITLVEAIEKASESSTRFIINETGKVLPYTVSSIYPDSIIAPHSDNGWEVGLIIVGEALPESLQLSS